MKKRFLAIITMIVVVATMVCMGSMSVSAVEVKYNDPTVIDYTTSDWFDSAESWGEYIHEKDGVKTLHWESEEVAFKIKEQGNWGRTYYGQEIVKTSTEQYLRLYDKKEGDIGYVKTPITQSRFFIKTDCAANSAGLPEALKIVMRVRKVGDDWANASGINFHSQFCDKPNNLAWVLDTKYNEELLAGPTGEWFEITKLINISSEYVGIDSIQMMFDYGDVTDAELHIQSISFYVPMDMSKIPEINPETATFDGSNPADIVLEVELKDYDLKPIKFIDSAAIGSSNYKLSSDKTQLTIKKEFLSTLENGEYSLDISTIGGDGQLTITVVNSTVGQNNNGGQDGNGGNTDAPTKGGCGSIITATSSVLASMLLASAILIFKKKEN